MAEQQIQEQLERLRRHVQEGRVPPQILERLERRALELQAQQVEQEHIPNNTEEEEKNNTNRNRTTVKRNGGRSHRKRKAHHKRKTHRRKSHRRR
jgi:hypothetical protein